MSEILSEPWMRKMYVITRESTTQLRMHPGYRAWQEYLRARVAEISDPAVRSLLLAEIHDNHTVHVARVMSRHAIPKDDIEAMFLLLFGDKAR